MWDMSHILSVSIIVAVARLGTRWMLGGSSSSLLRSPKKFSGVSNRSSLMIATGTDTDDWSKMSREVAFSM